MVEVIIRARLEALQKVLTEWSTEDIEKLDQLFERLRADMRRLS